MGLFDRQFLYLANDRLIAYPLKGEEAGQPRIFPNDPAGWADFSNFLATSAGANLCLLADLIEEDFQTATQPHVLGKPGITLTQRRLSQLYRDTPYRHAQRQGREKEGRRDDRMLFSALTSSHTLQPWLDAIAEQKKHLTGICSPALLCQNLVKKSGLAEGKLLLVANLSSGIRQFFFEKGKLRFSRLMLEGGQRRVDFAAMAAGETANTLQYLTTSKMLARNDSINVVYLAETSFLDLLQSFSRDSTQVSFRFLDLSEAASLIGMKSAPATQVCDEFFLHELKKSFSVNHYASKTLLRPLHLWLGRVAIHFLSLFVFAASLFWAGKDLKEIRLYRQQIAQINQEIGRIQEQNQAGTSRLPLTIDSPQHMRITTQLAQMISINAPDPVLILTKVSRALDKMPDIKLDLLHWQVADNLSSATEQQGQNAQPPGNPDLAEELSAAMAGIPQKCGEALIIEGEVSPFSGNYRSAVESVQRLAAELRGSGLPLVEITQLPLEIKASARLSGIAGKEDTESRARFALKVIIRSER